MGLQGKSQTCAAKLLRGVGVAVMGSVKRSHPDEVARWPSRDEGRTIKVHIYRPPAESAQTPTPVLVNMCGSGFILDGHGTDDEYCRFIASHTSYTVVDLQYRLAPEHPFPAAFHDVEDAVRYIQQHPQQFDRARLALSGFSAGANLALAVSAVSDIPREAIHATVVFYPSCDLAEDFADKAAPDNSSRLKMPAGLSRFFHRCYFPASDEDADDPRISPAFAAPERFPDNLAAITAAQDPYAPEMERLAEAVDALPGRRVVLKRMEHCPHGWDKRAKEGTVGAEAKQEAYELVAQFLGSI
ncbi:putative esterase/lipase [Aspergillus saccharolyticus JOP 1030-1]|uniref:Putative esterase/lipase n=1 Tax=Aspergillus saccharolyticus JOP 1030-1 TaxID=1450539 RepID=A0A318ZSH0_9EURO|nr:putative esterase/lipase [Aspergillus saccharolyticus JOP 1030-1]PYH43018.1 putative esterase/lipase [Aspergillus saccharolyticus JOP 1030-1]